MNKQY